MGVYVRARARVCHGGGGVRSISHLRIHEVEKQRKRLVALVHLSSLKDHLVQFQELGLQTRDVPN